MHCKVIWSFEAKRDNIQESIAVVVDVWAATSNIALMLSHGADELILVTEETIHWAIGQFPNALVVGESTDPKVAPLFSCSNSPREIAKLIVLDRTIIYMTNNGTRVIGEALKAGVNQVMTASFVNISAVAKTLRKQKKGRCVIIASGERTKADKIPDKKAWEDYYCGEALREVTQGGKVDWKKQINQSQEFIKSHYDYSQVSLQLVHQIDTTTVIPRFIKGSDGLIHLEY